MTNEPKDEQAQERTDFGRTRSGDKCCVFHCAGTMVKRV